MQRSWSATLVLAAAAPTFLATPPEDSTPLDEITIAPGPWHGSVSLEGSLETFGTFSDGAVTSTLLLATAGRMAIAVTVNERGDVESGSMAVDIGWILESSGTMPATLDPFHVSGEFTQTGTLSVSGTVERLEASGALVRDSLVVDSEGNVVPEASGTRTDEVVWVFRAEESTCGLITGRLVEATPTVPLMSQVLVPVDLEGDSQVPRNDLQAVSRIWPDREDVDTGDITEDIAALEEVVNDALSGPSTAADVLVQLVVAAEQLRARLAHLDFCGRADSSTLAGGELWLADLIRKLAFRALENADELTAKDVVILLNTSTRGGALSGPEGSPLLTAFGTALDAKIEEAIANSDVDGLVDLAIATAAYGFTDLHDKVLSAYEELQ